MPLAPQPVRHFRAWGDGPGGGVTSAFPAPFPASLGPRHLRTAP
jgi:hypothetical protein